MRLKHILLPLAAILMMSGYFTFEAHQKSKFNSQAWIEQVDTEGNYTRHKMASTVAAYILKVGMTETQVETILGKPDEMRRVLCIFGEDVPSFLMPGDMTTYTYNIYQDEENIPIRLVLNFSMHEKLTHYEVNDGFATRKAYLY